jgi:hypothetical protein
MAENSSQVAHSYSPPRKFYNCVFVEIATADLIDIYFGHKLMLPVLQSTKSKTNSSRI